MAISLAAGTFVNHTMVAREALRHLKNSLVMGKLVFRGYEEEWMKNPNGWKVGATVNLKAPVYFRTKDGATLDQVELKERYTPMVVDQRKHVAWAVTAQQMTLNIDKFSERFIMPAMQALANQIDTSLLGLYTDVPNQVGTPGTTPNTFLTYGLAGARLAEEACPPDNKHCVVNPMAQVYLADHLKGLLHSGIVQKAITKGEFGDIAGFKMHMDQNVNTHTNGTWASGITALVKTTVSEGASTLDVKGGTTETAVHGDYFEIAAVNSVNPVSGISTGNLRGWTVDATATYDGTNIDALTLTPGTTPYEIRLVGESTAEDNLPYQNVSALPQGNAAVTIAGTTGQVYPVNLAFHRDAFALAMVPLEMPLSVVWKAQETYEGFTIRVIRGYDIELDQEAIRFDVLYGIKTINPMLACRIAG